MWNASSTSPKGLMFLEAQSAILHEQLYNRILGDFREDCEYTFCDFDDVSYKILCNQSVCKVQMQIRNAAELKRGGAADLIAQLYPGYEVAPDKGFNVAIEFDIDRLANREQFLKNICELRRNVFGAPFHRAFSALENGTSDSLSLFKLEYRAGEMLFICPGSDKIVVIFLVDFKDKTDKALAKLICQQFPEIRKSAPDCPVVSHSKEPPLELAGQSFQFFNDTCGFLSFAFERRHVAGPRLERAVTLLAGFRNYMHYHIKCAKTYLHIRMRKRVAGWLQVLNRAKPEVKDGEMKTADGKTFVRK